MISGSTSVSADFINQVGLSALNTRETSLRNAISSAGNNPSTVQMLDLQQQVQQWSLTVSIISTLYKETTDAMKAVVQKSGG
jgi:type III secretion protein F